MDEVFGACPPGSLAKDVHLIVMGADQDGVQAGRAGNGMLEPCEEI